MKTFSSCLLIFCTSFIISCGDEAPKGFSENACRTEAKGNSKVSESPSLVNIFIETSGSMFGFMPANTFTKFQTDVWKLVSSLNNRKKGTFNIYQVRDTNFPLVSVDVNNFRRMMNSGAFQASTSTDIPAMLDSVLARTDKRSVSILISDLIFSPENTENTAPKLAQITTDIRARFEGKGLASSLFYFSSNFEGRSAKPQNSPYYVWVIGEENKVLNVSATINSEFPSANQIDFGIQPRKLNATILPGVNPSGNALAIKCPDNGNFYTWSEYNGEGLKYYVALNLRGYPKYIQDLNYLKNNIEIESTDAEIDIISVEALPFKTEIKGSDKILLKQFRGTHLIQLNLKSAYEDETVLSVQIKQNTPNWISYVDSPIDDLSRNKTFGFKNMIKGLQEAYGSQSSAYVSEPFKIWISKNSID